MEVKPKPAMAPPHTTTEPSRTSPPRRTPAIRWWRPDQGTRRGSGVEQAYHRCPPVEGAGPKGGEESPRHAKDHGVHVNEQADDQGVTSDVGEALQEGPDPWPLAALTLEQGSDPYGQQGVDEEGDGVGPVGGAEAEAGHDEPGDGGADEGGGLVHRRVQGDPLLVRTYVRPMSRSPRPSRVPRVARSA